MQYFLNRMTGRLALILAASCCMAQTATAQSQYEASFSIERSKQFDRLIATVDGQQYWITNHDDPDRTFDIADLVSLNIKEQIDFDNDGNLDVLISASNGGASSIPTYLLASHLSGHFFHITSADGLYTYGDYELLPQTDGSTHLKVYYAVDGVGNHDRTDGFGIYALSYGRLDQIAEVTNHAQIPTMFEIKSSEMAMSKNQTFNFDLDADGIEDKFICRYWDRWGDFMCDIDLSNVGLLEHNWGVDHLGVAETTTNGIHDLVVNWVDKMTFDDVSFRSPKKRN